ncbi:VOC family protein [Microvirga thermotolerans]|uniref:VOC family protein n=1 Tax=Microvirga thermotolerans TaxID=2651334 RepID=A0A5P9JZA5_9HYPH|nr:VOC family protein [Microvirga thermotolerans]QFU18172.1 VOC family protein [Microvirga thermotolerans]
MQPRLSLVTLGVSDMARSRAFYEAWGWKASAASEPAVTFFQANGLALALFGRADLARDAGVEDRPTGFAAVTLAYNARSKAEADNVYARAIAAGATPVKPLQDAAWGGYSGYCADPDGHLWEVAWNPYFPLDEQGHLYLPDSLT